MCFICFYHHFTMKCFFYAIRILGEHETHSYYKVAFLRLDSDGEENGGGRKLEWRQKISIKL